MYVKVNLDGRHPSRTSRRSRSSTRGFYRGRSGCFECASKVCVLSERLERLDLIIDSSLTSARMNVEERTQLTGILMRLVGCLEKTLIDFPNACAERTR